jgi:hypothetical protein
MCLKKKEQNEKYAKKKKGGHKYKIIGWCG